MKEPLMSSASLAQQRPRIKLPTPVIKKNPLQMSKMVPKLPTGDDIPPSMEQDREIMCINCLDSISERVFETHRRFCSNYREVDISSDNALQNNSSKILKFLSYRKESLLSQDFRLMSLQSSGARHSKTPVQFEVRCLLERLI